MENPPSTSLCSGFVWPNLRLRKADLLFNITYVSLYLAISLTMYISIYLPSLVAYKNFVFVSVSCYF